MDGGGKGGGKGSPYKIGQRMSESAKRRKRTEKTWKKIKDKNSKKHMATIEEKVLRCVAMRKKFSAYFAR